MILWRKWPLSESPWECDHATPCTTRTPQAEAGYVATVADTFDLDVIVLSSEFGNANPTMIQMKMILLEVKRIRLWANLFQVNVYQCSI